MERESLEYFKTMGRFYENEPEGFSIYTHFRVNITQKSCWAFLYDMLHSQTRLYIFYYSLHECDEVFCVPYVARYSLCETNVLELKNPFLKQKYTF